MDVQGIASGLAATASLGASVGGTIDASVLSAVNNLAAIQSAVLFSSLGIGARVDTYA